MFVGRRQFLTTAAMAGGVILLGREPSASAQARRIAISLDQAPKLKQIGGSCVLAIAQREILFVRDTLTSVTAVHPLCTHQSCPLVYVKEENRFRCPCHYSRFALNGAVLRGPATRPLPTYEAQLVESRILVRIA